MILSLSLVLLGFLVSVYTYSIKNILKVLHTLYSDMTVHHRRKEWLLIFQVFFVIAVELHLLFVNTIIFIGNISTSPAMMLGEHLLMMAMFNFLICGLLRYYHKYLGY